MKIAFIILSAFLFSLSMAVSATLDKFLPWLSPNPLAFGTTFEEFKKIRPLAMDISGKEATPGEPFEGDLYERLPDKSSFVYVFFDDKLAAAYWGVPGTPETAKLLLAVRSSLLQTCEEETFGTSGRVKTRGGVARIIWEQYRPRINKNYLITLKATSESGIEVELIKEDDARKRGMKTVPPSYEEVVQSLPPTVQNSEGSSSMVDLLDKIRSGGLPIPSESQRPEHEDGEPTNPNAQKQRPDMAPEAKPEPSIPGGESPPSTWWPVVAVVIVTALGLLGLLLKKRK